MMYLKNNKGSILIWTMVLGMILTSVFLFTALRFNKNAALKRDTLHYLQQKAYLESYASYIEQLNVDQLKALKAAGVGYDGITGNLENEVEEWKGALDEGQSIVFPLNGSLRIEWSQCQQGLLKEEGSLGIDMPFVSQSQEEQCENVEGSEYNHWGMVTGVDTSFTLSSKGAPVHYGIQEGIANGPFEGKEWRLKLQMKLKNGRVLKLERTWEQI